MRGFVIAMTCEADVVRPFLKGDDQLMVSGVGKVNAAAATQRLIDRGATEILNAGVAGGFAAEMQICGVYEVSQAVEYDFDLADLNGTRIGVHNERATPYFTCAVTGKFPPYILASGDRFNDREDDLEVLRDLKVGLRDMEGAAIAHVCENNGIACRMLKCVSDLHGVGAMTAQYQQNLERALACLKSALTCWI